VLGRCLRNLRGHTRAVQGLAIAPNGEIAVSCSADCTVKVWKIPHAPFEHGPVEQDAKPVSDLVGQKAFMGVDYQFEGDKFATCGAAVDIWDIDHSEPIQTFSWGVETVYSIRFNPVRRPARIILLTFSGTKIVLYGPIRRGRRYMARPHRLCEGPAHVRCPRYRAGDMQIRQSVALSASVTRFRENS
jgi:DDB1- and CUL4-associated factor 13